MDQQISDAILGEESQPSRDRAGLEGAPEPRKDPINSRIEDDPFFQSFAESIADGEPIADSTAAQDSRGQGASDGADADDAGGGEKPWTPADLPEHMSPEDAYGAAKYFQSVKDQIQNDLADREKRLEDFQTIAPVAEWLLSNPDVLSQVRKAVSGGSVSGESAVNPSTESAGSEDPRELLKSLKMPEAPTKPANYSREEAVYQPDSESAKYDAALEAYRDKRIETLMERDRLRDQIAQLDAKERQRLEAETKAERELRQLRDTAVQKAQYEHQLSRKDAESFVEWAQSGDALNDMAAWVAAWRYRNTNAGQQKSDNPEGIRQTSAADRVRQSAGNRYPRTVGANGASGIAENERQQEGKTLDALVDRYNTNSFRP